MKQKVSFLIVCTCYLLITSCSDMLTELIKNHGGTTPYMGDVRITNAIGDSMYASLVWTGTEYGVAWSDNRDGNSEIYFTRINSSGIKQGADIRITNALDISMDTSLVCTGTEYGVAWEYLRDGNFEIYFARINSSGVKQGADIRITNDTSASGTPSLVYAGSEYGLAWNDNRDGIGNYEIYFARLYPDGTKK
ncbi:MAG: hypothetical protein JW822_09715 [Spirochaetales bacterium]|nr:hypothetical protein [Spirochaetales bacterium]